MQQRRRMLTVHKGVGLPNTINDRTPTTTRNMVNIGKRLLRVNKILNFI